MKIYLLLIAILGTFASSHSLSIEERDFVCSVEAEDSQSVLFKLSLAEQGKAKVSEKWAYNLPPIELLWDVISLDERLLMLSDVQNFEALQTKVLLIDLGKMVATHIFNTTGHETTVYQGGCM